MLAISDPAVQAYIVYAAILSLKLLSVGLLTAKVRYGNKLRKKYTKPDKSGSIVDPEVERVRRAHLNDLENIPAFLLLAALYLTTGPEFATFKLILRVYTAFRVIHTIVYAVTPLPQPSRFIACFVPYAINLYIGVKVTSYYVMGV